MQDNRMRALTFIFLLLAIGFLIHAFYALGGRDQAGDGATPVGAALPVGNPPRALRITVNESGIMAVTRRQVEALNLPFTQFAADGLQLMRDGQSVPFYIDRPDAADATLYFYGQAESDPQRGPAVYRLQVGRGSAMASRPAAPTGPGRTSGERSARWEENTTFLAQANADDMWFGPLIFAPAQVDVPLTGIRPAADADGRLTVRVWSNNEDTVDPDHRMRLLLNNRLIADARWDGIRAFTFEVELETGVLQPADNVLRLDAPGDTGAAGEALYVDWIALQYSGELTLQDGRLQFNTAADNVLVRNASSRALVFDISTPQAPLVLTDTLAGNDGVSFATSDLTNAYIVVEPTAAGQPLLSAIPYESFPLRDPALGADYIAIVPDDNDFRDAIEPLLSYRRESGLTTELVKLEQVYDEFGFSRRSPEAIRDFLAYASANWQPAPRFVLLVGDASYDRAGYLAGSKRDILPTRLAFTEYAGHVASDNWFAAFDPASNAPQVAIGRFPVQNAAQLRTVVAKTLTYERNADADYLRRTLLVADDEAYFNTASDQLADQLAGYNFDNQKLYMTEQEDVRDAIITSLNSGVGIVNYVGHGSVRVWGDERVFQVEDAAQLSNGDRLPIFTTFTCLNGYFNHHSEDALAEALLWAEGGGIVAAIAPSGRSLTAQQTPLANEFFRVLLSGEVATLGEALERAKLRGANDPFLIDVIDTFNLLGDPALRLHLPAPAAP